MSFYLDGRYIGTRTRPNKGAAYTVTVSDGQLNLLLQDLGGSDAFCVVNGLDVVAAGP